jgi:hypothetical protein
MSADKVFERRKGSRKIPVEDVATLVRMGKDLDSMADLWAAVIDRKDRVALRAYAVEIESIVQRCGGSPYESEEK